MPTRQETRFLILAEAYINNPVNEQGLFPDHKWFEDHLGISKSGVGNLKNGLIKNEYLEVKDGRVILTNKARGFLDGLSDRGEPVTLYILTPGGVSAGRARGGELPVLAGEINDTLTDSIPIPKTELTLEKGKYPKIVAYRVFGDSMERDGIVEGDYVLVEVDPKKALAENRLIVTKYLLKNEFQDRDMLRGPTLKFYKGMRGKYAILTTSQVIFEKPYSYEIEASYLEPIGRVIGVYRSIK